MAGDAPATEGGDAARTEEERGPQPFENVNSDGEEFAVPVCSFSDSEDDGEAPAKPSGPAYAGLRGEELRSHFTASLRDLNGVRRHNHRDRGLAQLPPGALRPSAALLEAGGPLPYIDAEEMSTEKFTAEFVVPQRPAMILGAAKGWRATERWSSKEEMLQHYGDVPFKVSEIYSSWHPGGKPLKIELPLRLYVEHAEEVAADFPFYVFERELSGPRAQLLEDFEPPAYFRDDLYDLTEYTRAFFPLYRYMVIGVERTGSNLHVDPSCTSAWNTLLCGLKRWCLFPPGDDPEYLERIGAAGRAMGATGAPPANWWLDVLPRLREDGAERELGMIECVQRPGETIYVPYGWWHCVLNIGFTVAITQNLLAPEALPYAWPGLAAEWPEFSGEFAVIVQDERPDVKLPAAALEAAASQRKAASTGGTDSPGAGAGVAEPVLPPSPLCCAPIGGTAGGGGNSTDGVERSALGMPVCA